MFDLLKGLNMGLPLADIPDGLFVLGILGLIFTAPVVAILTHHQRKMAELIHRNQPQQVDPLIQQQLNMMQGQIADMRLMMQEHIINNDRTATTNSVEQRLNS